MQHILRRSFLAVVLLAQTVLGGTAWADSDSSSQPAAHFYGSLLLGNLPAKAGTRITVVRARSGVDLIPCGSTTVSDDNGSYTLDVPRSEPCINRTATQLPVPLFIFLVDGQAVGNNTLAVNLEELSPRGWLVQEQLAGALLPPGLAGPNANSALVPAFFTGTFRVGDTYAARGLSITVSAQGANGSLSPCGTGSVVDDYGGFAVALEPKPGVCEGQTSAAPAITYVFQSGGETVGRKTEALSVDLPTNLAAVKRLDLTGTASPDCPPGTLCTGISQTEGTPPPTPDPAPPPPGPAPTPEPPAPTPLPSVPQGADVLLQGAVDASAGGTVGADDGSLSVSLAPNDAAVPATWQVTVSKPTQKFLPDPSDTLILVGSSLYYISVRDEAGTPVAPSLTVTVQPDEASMALANGDPSAIPVQIADETTDQPLPTTVNDDGTLTFTIPGAP